MNFCAYLAMYSNARKNCFSFLDTQTIGTAYVHATELFQTVVCIQTVYWQVYHANMKCTFSVPVSRSEIPGYCLICHQKIFCI
jgi:hypothetical protein